MIPMRLYANWSATVAKDFAAGLRTNCSGTDCDLPALPTLQCSPIFDKMDSNDVKKKKKRETEDESPQHSP
jgi:hypothetical protein